MIRPFSIDDISHFPNIKILEAQHNHKYTKNYLLIERPPFISAFISINHTWGIFVEQFRPIINKTTIEIPMGKMETYENSPHESLIRELQEECNLFLTKKPYLLLKNHGNQELCTLYFEDCHIIQHPSNYLSPGFSTSLQHPFMIELTTQQHDIHHILETHYPFSNEDSLNVYIFKLEEELLQKLDGISRYYLINFLYEQQKKHL